MFNVITPAARRRRSSSFAALPRDAANARLPAKPSLSALDPSLWWVHALRRTVWHWRRRTARRGTASLVWC
jgi:hypothetical protein